MIKVIKKDEDNIIIRGHANYEESGKDIVCAAVSSIVITTVNAIEMFNNKAIEYNDEDGIEIKINKHDDITDKLIYNMFNLLEELENDYPQNIKIL